MEVSNTLTLIRRIMGRRRVRVFRELQNPLERYSEEEIIRRFRFNTNGINYILQLIYNDLAPRTNRNRPIPPLIQLLVFLRFVACGCYQIVLGDLINISQPTISRIIRRVANLLSRTHIVEQYIKWPESNADIIRSQRKFYEFGGFPQVTGLVDGTHIRIIAPKENEHIYVGRKGFHSINVQATCDCDGFITSIVAKWPGSANDSRIMDDSGLKRNFDEGNLRGLVLGDSGYGQKRWLMTPFLNPNGPIEEEYNRCHKRTRCLIERTFGVLKRRFGCLHQELRYHPTTACHIVTACAVLHNIAKQLKMPLPEIDEFENEANIEDGQEIDPDLNLAGTAYRRAFAAMHFS